MSKKYVESIKTLFKKVKLGSNDSQEEVDKKLIGENSILCKGLDKILKNEKAFDEQGNVDEKNSKDDGTSKRHRFKKKIILKSDLGPERSLSTSGTHTNLQTLMKLSSMKNINLLCTALENIYKKELEYKSGNSLTTMMLSPLAGIRRVKKEALELKTSIENWLKNHPNK